MPMCVPLALLPLLNWTGARGKGTAELMQFRWAFPSAATVLTLAFSPRGLICTCNIAFPSCASEKVCTCGTCVPSRAALVTRLWNRGCWRLFVILLTVMDRQWLVVVFISLVRDDDRRNWYKYLAVLLLRKKGREIHRSLIIITFSVYFFIPLRKGEGACFFLCQQANWNWKTSRSSVLRTSASWRALTLYY